MPNDSRDIPPVFRIDVAQSASEPTVTNTTDSSQSEIVALLHQLVIGQDRQNELLEEMTETMQHNQRNRAGELQQWKDSNPLLARRCRAVSSADRVPAVTDL